LEQYTTSLNKILLEPASLKLSAAWQLASNEQSVSLEQVGAQELIDLINTLKILRANDNDYTSREKKYCINYYFYFITNQHSCGM